METKGALNSSLFPANIYNANHQASVHLNAASLHTIALEAFRDTQCNW